MEPIFFAAPADFRLWLEAHHGSAPELWVGFYKKGTGRESMSWPESVDEALCFGWIDAVRKRIDQERYMIRFTRRRPQSIWSVVNIGRVNELLRTGQMRPAGIEAFQRRSEEKSGIYAHEQREGVVLDQELEQRFRESCEGWRFFEAQPASYRRQMTWWVIGAKREETRRKRLDALIEASAAGKRMR